MEKGAFFDYLTASEGAGPPIHTGGSISVIVAALLKGALRPAIRWAAFAVSI